MLPKQVASNLNNWPFPIELLFTKALNNIVNFWVKLSFMRKKLSALLIHSKSNLEMAGDDKKLLPLKRCRIGDLDFNGLQRKLNITRPT